MRKRIVALVVTLGSISVAACGDSSSNSGINAGPSIALEDVPALYAEATCAAYANCAGVLAEVFVRSDECVDRTTRALSDSLPAFQAAIDGGTVGYHGDKMQACLDEIEARSCDDLLLRDTATCDAALDGTVEADHDCTLNVECAGAAYCKFDGACPGTCTELGGEGDDCEKNDQCADGLVCNGRSSVCVSPADDGDACDGDNGPPCGPGMACIGASRDTGESGECMTSDATFTAKDGEDCSVLTGPLCESGLSCVLDDVDGTTPIMSCHAKVESGQDCKTGFPDMCPDDEYCNASGVNRVGTCETRPEAGDACGTSGFDAAPTVCESYAVCVNGTCRAMQRLDGSCDNNAMCYSSNCLDGKCAAADSCE